MHLSKLEASRTDNASGSRRLAAWAAFLLTVACVWLGGQFLTQGLSDYALSSDPEAAVLWRADSADALTALARKRLLSNDSDGAARLALRAIERWPMDEDALATFSVAEADRRQNALSDAAMRLAGDLGWRSVLTQAWLLRSDVKRGAYSSAVLHLDALMRRMETPPPGLLRVAALLAQNAQAREAIVRQMTDRPPWRTQLIVYLASEKQPGGLATARALLMRLAEIGARPSQGELDNYLDQVVVRGDYSQAFQDWLRLSRTAPVREAILNNGSFSHTPDGTPFDWSVDNGVGWSPSIARPPTRPQSHALRVDYDGVSAGAPMRQILVLPPGRYQLSGIGTLESADATTLAWAVTCAGGQPLARAPAPAAASPNWARFSADFEVPLEGCPAQWVALDPEPGERPNETIAWFTGLSVVPEPGALEPTSK